MKILSNFNLELLHNKFDSYVGKYSNPEEAIMSAINGIDVELFGVRRYDKLTGELIFENLDTGITKAECCFGNQYIGELFQDYIDRETVKPDNDFILSVKNEAKIHIINNLKRIFKEQIGLTRLKVKPEGWQKERVAKYTIRNHIELERFIHRTINIAHEECWIVNEDKEMMELGKIHETYYGAMNWHDIIFEAQTRSFRRSA
ncbi:hypothetical protein [Ammoniphilus resinae]|uniref:Uncharacterized protein n=1 Tax=Ammoniphilus resinae TaxID=861532 RepID=A0ABS4GXN3_9BACL|nr:hypothetical protein [Ammoniphilus resinae]MBP1935023.1 hypothetical protein [Ammoniphilus resinae]